MYLLLPWRAERSYRRHLDVRDPFEAMIGHTASLDGLLAEIFRGFLSHEVNARKPGDLYIVPYFISLSPLSLVDGCD
jgi:hypothetical protein